MNKLYILFIVTLFAVATLASYQVNAKEKMQYNIYENAIENPNRLKSDLVNDVKRKPALILPFTQIQEGDKILELGAGGGYTTELISWSVGKYGKVYAHFLYNQERLNNERLSNVVSLRQHTLLELNTVLTENNINENALDSVVVFFILHDIYLNKEMDEILLQTLYTSLKSGGTIVVLDNAAKKGTELEAIGTLHRIDEDFVISEFKKFGFVLDGTSDVLRNPKDNHTKPWGDFDGLQDRFAFRFKKP
jgi:predicted methyltransferase